VLGPLLDNKLLIVLSILIAIVVVVGGLFVLVMSRQVSRQASRGMRQRRARKERTRR
jgi:flagellar basal body-associated protein FliL